MLTFQWVPNILCVIKDGKAQLSRDLNHIMDCSGQCHACNDFHGVDLADTGKAAYRSCCIEQKRSCFPSR